MRSKSSSGRPSSGCGRWPMPALLTRTSRLPKRSTAAATIACTSRAFVTSARTPTAFLPSAAAARSAPAPSRSATTTFAPSATNFLAMPSPNPDAAPVTTAIFPSSRMASPLGKTASAVLDRDRLQRREAVQRLEPLLATVPGMLDAAERQLDAAAGAVVVDEDLAAPQRPRHPERAAAVARPDAGDEAVLGAVGDPDRVGLVVERDQHLHRSEDLLLRE